MHETETGFRGNQRTAYRYNEDGVNTYWHINIMHRAQCKTLTGNSILFWLMIAETTTLSFYKTQQPEKKPQRR